MHKHYAGEMLYLTGCGFASSIEMSYPFVFRMIDCYSSFINGSEYAKDVKTNLIFDDK